MLYRRPVRIYFSLVPIYILSIRVLQLVLSLSSRGGIQSFMATEEKNVVGDQRNWEQRINTELESARMWAETWGPLFDKTSTMDEEIKHLEEKVKTLPGQGVQTNSQLSYEKQKPFQEYPVGTMCQRNLRIEDVEELAREMMAKQTKETTVGLPTSPKQKT